MEGCDGGEKEEGEEGEKNARMMEVKVMYIKAA